MQLGGDTTVHGDVNIDVGDGASLSIFGGGQVVFVGDLTFNPAPTPFPNPLPLPLPLAASMDGEVAAASTAESVFSVTLGDSPGLEIGGMLDLGTDLTLDVTYDGSVPSMEDDVLTVLTALGGIEGVFTNSQLFADGRLWEINSTDTQIFITALGIGEQLAGDFDGDSDVDGADFLIWQRDLGDADSLADYRANFGLSIAGGASAVSAVPEPTTLAIALLTLVCYPRRRLAS